MQGWISMKLGTKVAEVFNGLFDRAIDWADAYSVRRQQRGPGAVEKAGRGLAASWEVMTRTIADPRTELVALLKASMQDSAPAGPRAKILAALGPKLRKDDIYTLTGMAVQHRRADILDVLCGLPGFRENLDILAAGDGKKLTHRDFAVSLGYFDIVEKLDRLRTDPRSADQAEVAPAA